MMMDGALLDELARVFARAAVDALLREGAEIESPDMKKPAGVATVRASSEKQLRDDSTPPA